MGIFIDYGLLMIDYWVVGSENDEVGRAGSILGFRFWILG
jgi:hypothetical protein